jgi:pectinesterase
MAPIDSRTKGDNDDTGIHDDGDGNDHADSDEDADPDVDVDSAVVIEESAVGFCWLNGVVESDHSGYSGSGYANTDNAIGSSAEWAVVAAGGPATLRWRYASTEERPASLIVNGTTIGHLDFSSTNNWSSWAAESRSVDLAAGNNTIRLTALGSSGLGNIDNLTIAGAGVSPGTCEEEPDQDPDPDGYTDCNDATGQPILQVAADGSGEYRSVQRALDSLSRSNATPTQIRIKPGRYYEKILVDKPNVTLCGETNRERETLLTFDDNASSAGSTSGSYSVKVTASDVSVENITIQNSTGPGVQAVALMVQGQRAQFRNCRFVAYQDTLYTHSGTQYFRDCFIQGNVDYIFGGATAVLENCSLYTIESGTAITAPSTAENEPYGIVFLGGEATAHSSIRAGSQHLGRNWRPFGSTTYIGTWLGDHISDAGWGRMGGNTLDTARFAEYETTGPGASPSTRAPQSKQLSDAEAAAYTVENIFGTWKPSFSR